MFVLNLCLYIVLHFLKVRVSCKDGCSSEVLFTKVLDLF